MRTPRAGLAPLNTAALLLAFPSVTGCHGAQKPDPGAGAPTIQLTTANFTNNGHIPASCTCDGANTSPALTWSAPPAATRSYALILDDPDAPAGTFVHWVFYNVPATAHSLPAGEPRLGQLADGSRQGRNDFGDTGYEGPCPPGHSPHHYQFVLYAVDTSLNLPAGATKHQVEEALKGHVVAEGKLVGVYNH
jgi:Raf kinase inhibitor-like YbhB/YbcL family protein